MTERSLNVACDARFVQSHGHVLPHVDVYVHESLWPCTSTCSTCTCVHVLHSCTRCMFHTNGYLSTSTVWMYVNVYAHDMCTFMCIGTIQECVYRRAYMKLHTYYVACHVHVYSIHVLCSTCMHVCMYVCMYVCMVYVYVTVTVYCSTVCFVGRKKYTMSKKVHKYITGTGK